MRKVCEPPEEINGLFVISNGSVITSNTNTLKLWR